MSTATASDPMGLKRICTNCGSRFYDMNKRPIICPSCETEFTLETKIKGRRGRNSVIEAKSKKSVIEDNVELEEDDDAKIKASDEDDDDILEDEDDGVEAVSLDDLEEDSDDDEDDPSVLDDEDTLDDIPDLDDLDDDLDDVGDEDDTLLEEDDDQERI